MKEIVELYTRLVIAMFGFIGPSFSLLIPLFYSAIENAQSRSRVQIKVIQYLINENPEDDGRAIELNNLLKRRKKEIRQLRPEYHILRLMIGFATAIFFIGLYYLLRAKNSLSGCIWFKIGALFFSCIGFVYSLQVLWQLLCAIIKAKEEEQKMNRKKRTDSDTGFLMSYSK